MEHISELRDSLNVHFNWNKARITCFVKMLLALFSTRTINLNKLACIFSSNAKHLSRYRRIQRFFAEFRIDYDVIAGFIFKIFFVTGGQWYLTITTNSRGLSVDIDALFYDLKPGEQRVLTGKRKVWKHQLYLAALRLLDGDLLIVATNESPEDAIKIYGIRSEIETLFGCLKGRGFHFEDTHIIDLERIKKLFVLLAIAFCWAHKTGEWRNEAEPIKIKKHGRPSVSLFRYGLDYIAEAVAKVFCQLDLFEKCLARIRFPQNNISLAGKVT